MVRSYHDLKSLGTLEERFNYLSVRSTVGVATFGSERYVNQRFYTSTEWRRIRDQVIVRDMGCDLGVPGYEIHGRLYIHHLNPMTVDEITRGDPSILDPEFLITTTQRTHNAIHYSDASLLPQQVIERRAGDTKLW